MKKYNSIYENKNSDYIIYLDLDGVLTDFQKHFKDHFGIEIYHGQTFLPQKELFDKISSIPHWWATMPWTKHGQELLSLSKKLCSNVELLTTPADTVETCREDKYAWVLRNIPDRIKLNFSSSKEDYANPKTILIDDTKENVEKFVEQNGIGIYFNIDDVNAFEKLKNKLREIFKTGE